MLPAFIICESSHYTLEKFIFYVKELNNRLSQYSIVAPSPVGVNEFEFRVHGISESVPAWLEGEATHSISAVRITEPKDKNEVKFEPGTAFFILSNTTGEYE